MTNTATAAPAPVHPILASRIDAIDGCQGRWLIDASALGGDAATELGAPFGYNVRIGDRWSAPTTATDAAAFCASTLWRCHLLWHSQYLDDDCGWPGGYSADAVYRSNARVWREDHKATLERDPDAGTYPGAAFDIRYCNDDMVEALAALEGYPLLDEEDHSELQREDETEAWENHLAHDWGAQLERLWKPFNIDADDVLAATPAGRLRSDFEILADEAGQCWYHSSEGPWIDVSKVAESLTAEDLAQLAGGTLTLKIPRKRDTLAIPHNWPTVAINCNSGEPLRQAPAAWIGAVMAVTPFATADAETLQPRRWSLTHVASGFSAGALNCSRRQAVAFARSWDLRFGSLDSAAAPDWPHAATFTAERRILCAPIAKVAR